MKITLVTLLVFVACCLGAQSFVAPSTSILSSLGTRDSIVYYQCHVEEATQQISTASGQSFTSTPQKYSITEKYIIKKR